MPARPGPLLCLLNHVLEARRASDWEGHVYLPEETYTFKKKTAVCSLGHGQSNSQDSKNTPEPFRMHPREWWMLSSDQTEEADPLLHPSYGEKQGSLSPLSCPAQTGANIQCLCGRLATSCPWLCPSSVGPFPCNSHPPCPLGNHTLRFGFQSNRVSSVNVSYLGSRVSLSQDTGTIF